MNLALKPLLFLYIIVASDYFFLFRITNPAILDINTYETIAAGRSKNRNFITAIFGCSNANCCKTVGVDKTASTRTLVKRMIENVFQISSNVLFTLSPLKAINVNQLS